LAGRYAARTRRLVVQARRRLVNRKVGLLGAKAIQQELRTAQLLRRVPSLSTIRRILHEYGLSKPPRPAPQAYFPQPTPTVHYVLHAMDWTARYLEGGPKVFAFHTIDLQTHAIAQTLSTDKTALMVQEHALQAWQTLGLPDGLQMDNDSAFTGGGKAARNWGGGEKARVGWAILSAGACLGASNRCSSGWGSQSVRGGWSGSMVCGAVRLGTAATSAVWRRSSEPAPTSRRGTSIT